MKLEFKGTLKADFEDDYMRKEVIIEIYDTDSLNKDGEYPKVGQINGWYYDTWHFNSEIDKMLVYADDLDGDGFQILEAVTSEDGEKIKDGFGLSPCHIFITIDRLYIFKEFRNKGYAIETMKNIKRITGALFDLEPLDTVVGLIVNPFEVNKEEADLDLSFDNITLEDGREKLMEFYKKADFNPTEKDKTVFYK